MIRTDEFLGVTFVANRLGVSKMTVYRLIQSGELPVHKFGGSYRVRRGDLDDYIEASRITGDGHATEGAR